MSGFGAARVLYESAVPSLWSFWSFGFFAGVQGLLKHRLTVNGNIETHGPSALDTFLQAAITTSQHWAPVFEPLFFVDATNFFSRDALRAFGSCALFFYQKVRSILQTMHTLLELSQSLKVKLQCGIAIAP